MASLRAKALRLSGALVCAYLLVLQAALGGLASAGHVSATLSDPFAVTCLNSVPTGDSGEKSPAAEKSSCCLAGCLSGTAAPASTPEAALFAYDLSPTPRRSLAERETAPRRSLESELRRPRGPPAIG